MVGLDAMPLWPSNATYLASSVGTACAITNLSQDNACHVQMPQIQSSTTPATVLKHRRAIEDQLIGHKLDVGCNVMLLFDREESHKNDNRKGAQVCVCATSTNYSSSGFSESESVKSSTIGPVPLIRVADMLGQDLDDNKLSAGLRTEQPLGLRSKIRFPLRKGVPCHVQILKSYVAGLNLADADAFVFADVLPNRQACNLRPPTYSARRFVHRLRRRLLRRGSRNYKT